MSDNQELFGVPGDENQWLDAVTFTIREEEEVLYLVRSQYYDSERGLHFDDESED